MKTINASGHIEKGELKIYNEEVFWQQIHEVGFADHVRIELMYGKKRTLDQNAYLWGGIVNPLSVVLQQQGWEGYEPDYLYRDLEKNFSKTTIENRLTGEEREVTVPFKKLDTEQFAEVIENIRNWVHNSTKIDIHLKTPAEYFGMDDSYYSEWKAGIITKEEAIMKSRGVDNIEDLDYVE